MLDYPKTLGNMNFSWFYRIDDNIIYEATEPGLKIYCQNGRMGFIEFNEAWKTDPIGAGMKITYDGSANTMYISSFLSATSTNVISIVRDNKQIGIGTINPLAKLHISCNSIAALYVERTSTHINHFQISITNAGGMTANSVAFISGTSNSDIGLMCSTLSTAQLILRGATSVFEMNTGQQFKRTAVSDVAYSITSSDYLIAFTSLSAARTVTVADELAISGRTFVVKDEKGNAGTNFIVVQPETKLIEGAAAYTIAANFGSARIYSDGANWFVL